MHSGYQDASLDTIVNMLSLPPSLSYPLSRKGKSLPPYPPTPMSRDSLARYPLPGTIAILK